MLGAILGDIIGSPYEFDQYNIKTTDFPLFSDRSRFTDDSVMTIAVAAALMNAWGQDDKTICKELVRCMQFYGRRYYNAGYGRHFFSWLMEDHPQPYDSFGNGSAMRVSPAGWLYGTLEQTLHVAELTASVSHNHPEGIKGAKAIAHAIYLARHKVGKVQIKEELATNYGYDLDTPLEKIRPGYHFDVSCQGSVPQAIRAFLEGVDYESTVRLAVSIGGDSDTIACIAGSIAEAYYGIDEKLHKNGLLFLDPVLCDVIARFYHFVEDHASMEENR